MSIKNILITGGSGLVGTYLTEQLLKRGYSVVHLTRSHHFSEVPCFLWNIYNQSIDERAFENIDTIIHLAGAGIADSRWTAARKKEIMSSRVKSTQLLATFLKNKKHSVRNFISASAIGYYGWGDENTAFTEESQAGTGFVADVSKAWEDEVDKIQKIGLRVVKIRIGIVFSDKGGALKSIIQPINRLVGSSLGTGRQIISWIHLDDLCNLFIYIMENENLRGVFNAVSPNPISNKQLTSTIAHVLDKPLWLPNVPAFLLRIILGEMSDIVLLGSRVLSTRINKTEFTFRFTKIEEALQNLLNKHN